MFFDFGESRRQKPVDNSKFYNLLGVSKNASPDEIKKGFRKAALANHPDRGGDEEKFKEIQRAYEVLSDEEKRQIYDEMGEEGLEQGGGPGMDAADLFDILGMGMGMGMGGGRRRPGKRKGEDIVFPMPVSLEELYCGATKKLRVNRDVLCTGCKGKGGSSVTRCRDCRGEGYRIMMRPIGPGMMQQMQVECRACSGRGEIIPEKEKCKKCRAEKIVEESKQLDVYVEKGMTSNDRVVLRGEADQAPNTETGDVVVVIQEKEHESFKRRGDHLFYKQRISLIEALTGFQFTIKHLDGRVMVVRQFTGVIKPGDHKVIKDEGMPLRKYPTQRGNLYIQFEIDFPTATQITPVIAAELKRLLPAPRTPMDAAPPTPSSSAASASASKNKKKKNKKKGKTENGTERKRIETDDDDRVVAGEDDGKAGAAVHVDAILEDVDMAKEESRFAQEGRRSAHRPAYRSDDDDDDDDDDGPGGGPPHCATH